MRYCVARLLYELHAAFALGQRHYCVRICRPELMDNEYLWCRCGRVFWPRDIHAAEQRIIDRLNRATLDELDRCRPRPT